MIVKKTLLSLRAFLQKRLCCQIPSRHYRTVRFPHPVGIVIGDGVRIGNEVRIYQNVTLGLLENTPASTAVDQYPILEDGVIVYAGAVIAGAVTIGAGSVIGANAVITKDVPPGSVAFGRNQIMAAGGTRLVAGVPKILDSGADPRRSGFPGAPSP